MSLLITARRGARTPSWTQLPILDWAPCLGRFAHLGSGCPDMLGHKMLTTVLPSQARPELLPTPLNRPILPPVPSDSLFVPSDSSPVLIQHWQTMVLASLSYVLLVFLIPLQLVLLRLLGGFIFSAHPYYYREGRVLSFSAYCPCSS